MLLFTIKIAITTFGYIKINVLGCANDDDAPSTFLRVLSNLHHVPKRKITELNLNASIFNYTILNKNINIITSACLNLNGKRCTNGLHFRDETITSICDIRYHKNI